jgi:hypothetical protein
MKQMETHSDATIKENEHSEGANVQKKLSDSDKELLNLIAEIIVKIVMLEEE